MNDFAIPLLTCFATRISFPGEEFEIFYCSEVIKIYRDSKNYVIIRLKNQQVPYKAVILGGFAFSEEVTGVIDFKKYFRINWLDDLSVPELTFNLPPVRIVREYDRGMKIELGIEMVKEYRVLYPDGVKAEFIRKGVTEWDFEFSSGFSGSFRKDADGSHSIRFKGVRIDADVDGYNSESKFIISRSRYTDNLLLILQDQATVELML